MARFSAIVSLQSILFDLDGTLIDSVPGIEQSAQAAVDRVLPGVRLPGLRRFIGPPVRSVLRNALAEVAQAPAAGVLGEIEAEFRIHYDTLGWRQTKLFRGVRAVLNDLAGQNIRCFIATNKPSFSTMAIVHELGLAPLMVEVLCRDSRRPAFASKAAVIACLMERHGISAEDAVFVGDTHDDADAALANGLDFIAARYGYGLSDLLPAGAPAIDCFDELPSALAELGAAETGALQPVALA